MAAYTSVSTVVPPPNAIVTPAYVSGVQTASGAPKSFAISCFEIGDCGTCLLSYLCTPCAMGWAREKLDGSDCPTTTFILNPIFLRWMVRSAYNIPGSPLEDCLLGLFCPCCTVNQAAQTTAQHGLAYNNAGKSFNVDKFTPTDGGSCCINCMYSAFCSACAIGTTLEKSMGMPCWMGCLFGSICSARSMVRYHYRIGGADCCEDFLLPYFIAGVTLGCIPFFPCISCCTASYFITIVMGILNEATVRGNPKSGGTADPGSYLYPASTTHQVVMPGGALVITSNPGAGPIVYTQQPAVAAHYQPAASPQYDFSSTEKSHVEMSSYGSSNPSAPPQAVNYNYSQPVTAAPVSSSVTYSTGVDLSGYPTVKAT